MFQRAASAKRGSVSNLLRIVSASVVLLVLSVGSGCGLGPNVSHVAIWQPVWLDDGSIYYLREQDSEGRELWRQYNDGRSERLLGEVRGSCADGTIRLLFRISGDKLGLGVECDGGESTELFSYNLDSRSLLRFATVGSVSDVAMKSDRSSGYLEINTPCGVSLAEFQGNTRPKILRPGNAEGRWTFTDAHAGCAQLAYSTSPALSRGGARLFFAAAPETFGKLPLKADELEQLDLSLYVWDRDAVASDPRAIMTLPQRGDYSATLEPAPDGNTVAIAFSGPTRAGVTLVDVANGQTRVLAQGSKSYDPTFSPDGRRLAYVANLKELVIIDLV